MEFQIKLKRNGGVAENELLGDLKMVAQKLGKSGLTMDEYEKQGQFRRNSYKRKFGSWNQALERAGLGIVKRGNNSITEEELFQNLINVWETLGRQPSQNDLSKEPSKFPASAYKRRFGTYNKALISFGRWSQGVENTAGARFGSERISPVHRTKRDANLRLRFLTMKKDDFKCKQCGRSPANHPGTVLEVDHIVPWSKGGETIFENLQTLCSQCNSGKSNL
jgi:hypothetical protein